MLFFYFLLQVERMQSKDINIVTRGNRMVIETARILLAVESDTRHTPESNIWFSLGILLGGRSFFDWDLWLDSLYASASAYRLGLNAELVQMLVEHGVKNSSYSVRIKKFEYVWELLLNVKDLVVTLRGVDECAESLNSTMNSFGNMYRCLSLSGIDENMFEHLDWEIGEADSLFAFTELIIVVARFSSQPGRSSRLIRHILSDLKASQIIVIKKSLVASQQFMTEDTLDEDRIATQNALEWITDTTDTATSGA